MVWIIVSVVVIGGLAALLILNQVTANKRMRIAMANGEIIQRPPRYEAMMETFTLRAMDPKTVTQAVAAIDYARMEKVSMRYAPEKSSFFFTGRAKIGETVLWNARLTYLDANGEWMRYRFLFMNWPTNLKVLSMNQLLTAIEKTFLALDPQTSVQTEMQKVTVN